MAQAPPNGPALDEFYACLERSQVESICDGKPFFCINAVKKYLAENDGQQLGDILYHIFKTVGQHSYKAILDRHVAMFCILIKIREGPAIKHFVREDLCDERLPLNPKSKDQSFPPHIGYESFCNMQWMFCAPYFTRDMDKNLDRYQTSRILPISKKTSLGGGGTAELHKIEIHGCYHDFHDKLQDKNHDCNSTSVRELHYHSTSAARY
jgi:hypothetical protein